MSVAWEYVGGLHEGMQVAGAKFDSAPIEDSGMIAAVPGRGRAKRVQHYQMKRYAHFTHLPGSQNT